MIHKLHTNGWRIYRVWQKKIVQMIFMNYISIIYIIKQPNGSIRWLHSVSESILPGHRLAKRIPKFQCFIQYVPLFSLAFGLFYAKVLRPVFSWAFSESALMQMCYFVFVFMHARHALLSLCLCSNLLTTKKIPFRIFIFRSVYKIQIWLKRMIHSFETFLINVPTWGRVYLISVCSLCNVIIWLQKTLI